MKNKLKLLGIIAAVAVIGFSMTSCDNNGGGGGVPSGLIGVWVQEEGTGRFEIRPYFGQINRPVISYRGSWTVIDVRGGSLLNNDGGELLFNFNLSGNTLIVTDASETFTDGTYTRQ